MLQMLQQTQDFASEIADLEMKIFEADVQVYLIHLL